MMWTINDFWDRQGNIGDSDRDSPGSSIKFNIHLSISSAFAFVHSHFHFIFLSSFSMKHLPLYQTQLRTSLHNLLDRNVCVLLLVVHSVDDHLNYSIYNIVCGSDWSYSTSTYCNR